MSTTAALTQALEAISDERDTHDAMLSRLTRELLAVVALHANGDAQGAIARCPELLNLAYDALGDCEAVEPLTSLIGYVEPEPEALS